MKIEKGSLGWQQENLKNINLSVMDEIL